MFSRTFNWLHVFTCLQLVACFLALATGYMFSLACNWLHVFPCLLLVTRFSALAELVTWGNVLTVFDAAISNNSFIPQSYLLDWFLFFSQIPMNHSWLIVLSLRPWIMAGTKIYSCKEDDTEKIKKLKDQESWKNTWVFKYWTTLYILQHIAMRLAVFFHYLYMASYLL